SVDEKIGQLLIPVTWGGFKSSGSDDFQKLVRDVRDFHVGGYHVGSGDAAGIAVNINELQRSSKIPLLVTADLEGGPGYVMFGATRFPLAMAIGATGSEQLAYAAGKATGEEARAIGIGMDFYPVVDVQNNPGNPIINIRSFGEDPQRVAALSSAYLKGVQDAGVLATAKHFPGHGDVATDSHLEMPILNVSKERLESLELVPFRAAINAGVAGVMSAHMYVPSIEPQKGLPSTLSHAVLTDLLRGELKFNGLVITDAMDMHGITNNYTEADATVRAFLAGADVILFPAHTDIAFNALKAAVQDGRITTARLDESVRRILQAKARIGLDRYKPVDVNRLSDVVGSKAHRDLAQQISDNAVTLVRDQKHALPLSASPSTRILQITLLDSRAGWREGPVGIVSKTEIAKRFPNTMSIQLDDGSSRNEYDMARQLAGLVDTVVVDAFIRVAAYKGSIDLTSQQLAFLRDLSAMQKPFVFALFGSPYVLQHIPELPSYILTYDTNPGSELSAVKAISGEIPFNGKLPVSLPAK
ncbi:MAG TPA: glycoside hydrolase family 3 N-terminal domain-containing protein, partial [Thermoanaerobaculia bacterium]|nr:glycoside hydrolase family 3 N-terminal domain-containing protein [Thermoanaerobaculia bacterium]